MATESTNNQTIAGRALPTIRVVTVLVTVALGLSALEWWAVNELYGADKFGGAILGASLVAILAALPYLMRASAGHWASAGVSALTAVVELLLCVTVLSSLSAMAAVMLPISITSRFMQGDSATDFIIFLMLTLGLVIAARGWAKYSTQALLASNALVEAERVRANLAERDRELARSELTVLRAQIEPHFLWNTLAHVQYLTRKRPEDAEKMTGHLIRYLRSAIPQTRRNSATLGSEVESAQAFLELMKIRMGERMTLSVFLGPLLSDVPFPPLLLQTLLENAIKHGVEPKLGPVQVSIHVDFKPSDRKYLWIEVTDNGVGLQTAPATQGTGLGLKSVRERLRLLYGHEAALTIHGAAGGGVISRIEIPFVNHPT